MIPISTFFIGLNGLIAFALSYIVVMERTRTRIWHGESKEDVLMQPDPLTNPTAWVATVEKISQGLSVNKTMDESVLQRKVRAHGNLTEYVPIGLLLIIALELMHSEVWLLWLLGGTLTLARIVYAYGVITKYGPSVGRAIGFFATGFVYIFGSLACVYYGLKGIL
ncbi:MULTISPECIES: MAPEG family protein [Nostocales]|uniref:Glutathione S-transferase n=3 Tax=Nostocales TaxID=1161 RepID=A0A0C1QNK6_9CYAN|nr:MAPEG family protein [Tolypothrix bouteillei]KAF3889507.1 glutathione S-transferase [Tolypothrix bouteillei VB521301]